MPTKPRLVAGPVGAPTAEEIVEFFTKLTGKPVAPADLERVREKLRKAEESKKSSG